MSDEEYKSFKLKQKHFIDEFNNEHLRRLTQSHLNIILLKQSQFVGTKALCISLKFLAQAFNYQVPREMIKPQIDTILHQISLPLFVCTQKDKNSFHEDPIEYIRLQVDNSGEMNIKKQLSHLVDKICAIKPGKKKDRKPPEHLIKFMQTIGENLENVRGQDKFTEALFYAFGSLDDKYQQNMLPQLNSMVQAILENHVFSAINVDQFEDTVDKSLLAARALWVYRKFARFDFNKEDHLLAATERVFQHLQHPNIVVRVEAAQTVSALLDHECVVNLVRPGLGNVLKVFLQIMDEVDFEELVNSLKKLVEVFSDEVAPYAKSLCMKLSEAFIRLVNNKGDIDDEATDEGLTAEGLMKAIRRVLESVYYINEQ